MKHYASFYRRNSEIRTEVCSVVRCENPVAAKTLCHIHYKRMSTHGSTRKNDKAGKTFFSKGYPAISINGRTFLIHRLVMEHELGRPLVKGENVHHKNGNKSDYRPDNLELWVTIQPVGQRPEDLVAYAKEILRRYDS